MALLMPDPAPMGRAKRGSSLDLKGIQNYSPYL